MVNTHLKVATNTVAHLKPFSTKYRRIEILKHSIFAKAINQQRMNKPDSNKRFKHRCSKSNANEVQIYCTEQIIIQLAE